MIETIYYSDVNFGGFRLFKYKDVTMRYMDYTLQECKRHFRQYVRLDHTKVRFVKDNDPTTYGFMF